MGVAPGGPDEGRHLHGLPASGLLSLLAIYLAWGSTYLAIRVAVREGAGWGPFWMGAARVLVAAVVLLALSRLRRARLRPTRVELLVLAGTGLLMWVGGNGLVNWAEQRVDSGLAALVVGTAPLSVAAMEAAIDRKAPTRRLVLSLVVGFAGLVVLSWPVLSRGTPVGRVFLERSAGSPSGGSPLVFETVSNLLAVAFANVGPDRLG